MATNNQDAPLTGVDQSKFTPEQLASLKATLASQGAAAAKKAADVMLAYNASKRTWTASAPIANGQVSVDMSKIQTAAPAFETKSAGSASAPLAGMDSSKFTPAQLASLKKTLASQGAAAAKRAAEIMLKYNESKKTAAASAATAGKPISIGDTTSGVNAEQGANENVSTVQDIANDVGYNEGTTDKFGDYAQAVNAQTEAQLAAQRDENDAVNKMYNQLDEESRKKFAEVDEIYNKQIAEANTQYSALKEFAKKAYDQAQTALGSRRAGQMSEVSGKLSGSGVSASMIANAMAEVRNNPAMAEEEAKVTKNYVDTLSGTVTTFDNLLQKAATNKSANTSAEKNFIKEIIAKRAEALAKLTAIKAKGIDAAFKPAVEAAETVAKASADEENKTKKSVYEQREYEKASEDVRMDKLQDSLFEFTDADRGYITSDDLRKAAGMASKSAAKQYLANLAKSRANEQAKGLVPGTGAGTVASASWNKKNVPNSAANVNVIGSGTKPNAPAKADRVLYKEFPGGYKAFKNPDGTFTLVNPSGTSKDFTDLEFKEKVEQTNSKISTEKAQASTSILKDAGASAAAAVENKVDQVGKQLGSDIDAQLAPTRNLMVNLGIANEKEAMLFTLAPKEKRLEALRTVIGKRLNTISMEDRTKLLKRLWNQFPDMRQEIPAIFKNPPKDNTVVAGVRG